MQKVHGGVWQVGFVGNMSWGEVRYHNRWVSISAEICEFSSGVHCVYRGLLGGGQRRYSSAVALTTVHPNFWKSCCKNRIYDFRHFYSFTLQFLLFRRLARAQRSCSQLLCRSGSRMRSCGMLRVAVRQTHHLPGTSPVPLHVL